METQPSEFRITFDREEDGRWIAEVEALPGVLTYGSTQHEAQAKVEALALDVQYNSGDPLMLRKAL